MIDTYTNTYIDDFTENFNKWPEAMGIRLSDYQPTLVTYFATQKQASDFLHIWLEARIKGLSSALKKQAKV